jgi:DNA-binding IclR family transcriptional regulator
MLNMTSPSFIIKTGGHPAVTLGVDESAMTIQSVKRAIDILTLFSPERPRLGITDISKMMKLPKPTVHGLVQTLIDQDFLIRDKETRKYSLGLKLYELGLFLSGTLKINQVGGGPAQRLSVKTGLMVRLAIWDKDKVLITMNLFPTIDDSMFFRQLGLGPRVPAHCSAVGKVILSTFGPERQKAFFNQANLTKHTPKTIVQEDELLIELANITKTGISRECEEYLKGLSCIGAAIYDDSCEAVAAISISGNVDMLNRPDLGELSGHLIQTAAEISVSLGCPPSCIMGRS